MSIELNKDILKIEEMRGREETQLLVETEVYLAQSKPAIGKLLWVDGNVDILSTKVIRDRVIVSGVVKFKIVYMGEEEEGIYTIDSNADFKEEIEIPNITEEMSAFIVSNIEYIEDEILDEKKVLLKALLSLNTKIEEMNSVEIITGMSEKEHLQTQKEKIRYKEVQGREVSYVFVKDSIEIDEDSPEIEEILKISISSNEEEATVVEDRIILSGLATPRIIYYGEDRISTIEKEIHFNHFIEMPGAITDSASQINMEVIEGTWDLVENEEGQLKVIDIEIKLRISANAFLENEKELIVDAYSTNEKLDIQRETISLIEEIATFDHREKIFKELQEYNIKEIYDITGYPTVVDKRIEMGQIQIEGLLGVQIIYLEDESMEIKTLKDEIPYSYSIGLEGRDPDLLIDVDLSIESIKSDSLKDPTNLEAVIKHKVDLSRNRLLSLVKGIEETGDIIDKREGPSITIYIVQTGDLLWDIAKRYNTTMEEILEANENINSDNIMPGEKIIIEKKVEIAF